MNQDSHDLSNSGAISILVINKVPYLPEIAIQSIRRLTQMKIYVGYMNPEDVVEVSTFENIEFVNLSETAKSFGLEPNKSYQSYASEDFFKLVQLKWSLFEVILENKNIDYLIYTDIDVAWLDNPIPFLEGIFAAHPEVNVCIQDASLRNTEKSLCMGFLALKNSTPVKSLILDCQIMHSKGLADNPRLGDDGVITEYYSKLANRSTFWLLPQISFPIGIMSNLYLDRAPFRALVPGIPYIFHANYLVGHQRKALMMIYALRQFNINIGISLRFLPKLYLRKTLLPLVRLFA